MKNTPSHIAIFDPFSGAAGDMVLGALIDVGLSLDDLRTGLRALPLDGYEITATPVNQHGLTGTHVEVIVAEGQPQRDWASIQPMIAKSDLPEPVRTTALTIFERLATAEAHVHGTEIATVHFHEVGAVDAIIDICGAALGLHLLGIDRIYSHPPVTGDGWVRAQHGLMPIPAPATAELLAMSGAPMGRGLPEGRTIGAELLTPTGAAILTTFASFDPPLCTPTAVGYGFGRKELPWPNALRIWLADAHPA